MAQEERQVLPPTPYASCANISALGAAHGIEVDVEFKPVEHLFKRFLRIELDIYSSIQ